MTDTKLPDIPPMQPMVREMRWLAYKNFGPDMYRKDFMVLQQYTGYEWKDVPIVLGERTL